MELIKDKASSSFICQEEEHEFSSQDLAPEGWLIRPVSKLTMAKTRCIKVSHADNDRLLAIAWVEPAEDSIIQTVTGVAASNLNKALFLRGVWIAPEAQGWTPAILYLALRRGRIWQRLQMVTLIENEQVKNLSLLRLLPLGNIRPVHFDGRQLLVYAQQLPYALHLCYQHCQGEPLKFIQNEFANEVLESVEIFLKNFFGNKFSQAVYNGTLTKQQYIAVLFNLHSYVRYTTRLIARCIAFSDYPELRNHWIDHLKGEVNHERIIERDLLQLDADVEYLTQYHVPNLGTKVFMVTQESTIGFYQNPMLFLACPLVAEGVTATITPDFLQALQGIIASWGLAKPEDAMRFISSHTRTDGGEDGHWENIKKMVKHFIQSETSLQQFLGVFEIAAEGIHRSMESSVEENYLWSNAIA